MPKPKEPTPASNPDPGEPNFDMSMFEQTGNLGAVNNEFVDLVADNRLALDLYDRNEYGARHQLGLTITPELEAAESQVCNMKREAMVKELGLEDALRRDGGNYVQFEQQYSDGAVTQVKYFKRGPNDHVGVRVDFVETGDGRNDVTATSIVLLSDSEVIQEARVLQEDLINQRLQVQFDLTSDFLEKSGLTLEDKQGMLESYDNVGKLELAPADLSKLDKVRSKLTKGIMPTRKGLRNNDAELAEVEEEYLSQLQKVASGYDQSSKEYQDIFQREQLLRLRSLNERLDGRKTLSKWLGRSIMAGVTLLGGGSGVAMGEGINAYTGHTSPLVPVIGGAIGVGSAAWSLTTGNGGIKDRKTRTKYTEFGFDQRTLTSSGSNVKSALVAERQLAKRYYYNTRFQS